MTWLLYLLIHCLYLIHAELPPLIYSVNCGGEEHVDALGIRFGQDNSKDGEASAWGTRYPFPTAYAEDHPLYQHERWSKDSFTYNVQLPVENAEYSIDFRFSEVFFERPGAKVFNILLNGQPLIQNLDIYDKAGGRGRPYDVVESFKIQDGNLVFSNVLLDFDGALEVTFAKGGADNPKCNAFAIFRAPKSVVPRPGRLQPPQQQNLQPAQKIMPPRNEDEEDDHRSSEKYGSGPKVMDPYANQDPLENLWPLLVVIPCLIPVVYFLHKMK